MYPIEHWRKKTSNVTPENIAKTVAHLARNNHAIPITKQMINVNGGVSFPG
jgi:NADP-dependent 3-hydroxy acid dehydrogenase YdfG